MLSALPKANGKVKAPYRWLQDRIVHISVYGNLTTKGKVRSALQARVRRHSDHQVRSTTIKHVIRVTDVPLREDVSVHWVPDETRRLMHVQIRWSNKRVHSLLLPLRGSRVYL